MKKLILVCLLAAFLNGCSSHSAPGSVKEKVGLKLSAQPRRGFRPLRVTFRATLQGVSETDPNYYCLEEKWDFGDGAVSSEKPHCEPFDEVSKIRTEFIVDHLYDDHGTFTVFLTLGDRKIRSNNSSIIVLKDASTP